MPEMTTYIQDWASHFYGLVITGHQLERIEYELHNLARSLNISPADYLQALAANDSHIVNTTIDSLTVQESYFFRDATLFFYLKNHFLPALIKEKKANNQRHLAIWCAGCARGEEVYSLAIYLHQLLPDIQQWNVTLIGTDINTHALELAKIGSYTRASMRATDPKIIKDYFEVHEGRFQLKTQLLPHVQFSYFNLGKLTETVNNFDLIFCRNVFIYLNRETIESSLHYFYTHLYASGCLFLGPSDLITYYRHPFSLETSHGIIFLSKNERQRPVAANTQHAKKLAPTENSSYTALLKDKVDDLQQIQQDLQQKKYSHVLAKIEKYFNKYGPSALLDRYKSEALMGLGDIATAYNYLLKSITSDPLDPVSYFLKGLVEVDLQHRDTAINSLKKAVYLKPKFPEAYYHLGLLYFQNNQVSQGIKSLEEALKTAQAKVTSKPIFSDAPDYAQLVQAVTELLIHYKGKST